MASANILTMGGGIEQQNISGFVKNGNTINYFNKKSAETDGNNNTGNLGLKDKKNPFIWAKLNVPLSFIPRIKAQYTRYNSTGHSNYIAGGTKAFGKVYIPLALTNASTKLSINSFDVTAYYNFPVFVADVSLGLGADIWKIHSVINDNSTNKNIVDNKTTEILPYLYTHFKTKKLFGISLLGTLKWAKKGDDHHYEYFAGLRYTLDLTGPINPFIEGGYKVKDIQGKDGDDLTKLKYKGAFAEIGFNF